VPGLLSVPDRARSPRLRHSAKVPPGASALTLGESEPSSGHPGFRGVGDPARLLQLARRTAHRPRGYLVGPVSAQACLDDNPPPNRCPGWTPLPDEGARRFGRLIQRDRQVATGEGGLRQPQPRLAELGYLAEAQRLLDGSFGGQPRLPRQTGGQQQLALIQEQGHGRTTALGVQVKRILVPRQGGRNVAAPCGHISEVVEGDRSGQRLPQFGQEAVGSHEIGLGFVDVSTVGLHHAAVEPAARIGPCRKPSAATVAGRPPPIWPVPLTRPRAVRAAAICATTSHRFRLIRYTLPIFRRSVH